MNHLHAVPFEPDEHTVGRLHAAMAQLRWDHDRMRRKSMWLVAGLPLAIGLLAAEIIALGPLWSLWTSVVVLAAYLA